MGESVLDIALGLAAIGWPVFPCGRSKKPAISKDDGGHGFHDATTDPDAIRALFARAPNARLVGVPTGEASGFDALDYDYRHGARPWEIENEHRTPVTRTHLTQSGGRHRLFRHAPGVRNLASKFAPGMDVRGDGGYIISPPSPAYSVEVDTEIAEWPDWLLETILPPKPAPVPRAPEGTIRADTSSKRFDALCDAILSRVRNAVDGQKHFAVRNAALSMGGIAVAAGLSDGHMASMLFNALPPVKDEATARETIAWGIEQGKARPIVLEDRPAYRNGHPNGHSHPHVNGHAPTPPETEPDAGQARGSEATDANLPTITVRGGLRHEAADAGLRAMVRAGVPFYQRDRALVRAATVRAKTSDGAVVEIPAIAPVTAPLLGRALGASAEWMRPNKDGELIRIDPPKELVDQIAAMSGDWPFPPLAGVIATPTMRPDGTILDRPGYDQATGLVLVTSLKMPSIPDRPDRKDAARALDLLGGLLGEFPFVDDASRAVAFSMILTVVLRGALVPAVPMHAATAPQPGTGKSYLSDIASAIATGERCGVMSMAPNVEETEKRLIGAALSGQQIIAIDNVSGMMAGDFLNQVTERPILQVRALGGSVMTRLPNTFTVFVNGNNLSAPADLVRRTLVCRLDANLENPEEREFHKNPVRMVMEDRGAYVAACLTIGRAYVVASRPGKCRPLPSFERWSDLVRSALVWLGMPDPCSTMDLARAEDPARAERAAFFNSWENEVKLTREGLTVSEMVEAADAFTENGYLNPMFREAILEFATDRKTSSISSKRLGWWLKSNKDIRLGDLKLTVNAQDARRPRWMLRKL